MSTYSAVEAENFSIPSIDADVPSQVVKNQNENENRNSVVN